MIRITRKYPEPETLGSKAVAHAKRKVEKIARNGKPQSKDFPSLWGNDDVRTALWEMQHHKCCYCERMREKNRESDIEHFRPKADVTEAKTCHKGYWWLAYEWENLYFSCRYCNQQFKQNHFPVPDESKRAQTPGCSLRDEEAFLIDPSKEDPEEHICFDWFEKRDATNSMTFRVAYVRDRTERGRRTIEIAGLNHGDLPFERGLLIQDLEVLVVVMKVKQLISKDNEDIQKIGAKIRAATSSKMPFTAFRRDFFRKNGLGEFVNND
jgi:uncharacterized protein (TIGR02646 family)